MTEPVLAGDGHSYERAAIEDWFAGGHSTSPVTNLPLQHRTLTLNYALRTAIEEFRVKRSAAALRPALGRSSLG